MPQTIIILVSDVTTYIYSSKMQHRRNGLHLNLPE